MPLTPPPTLSRYRRARRFVYELLITPEIDTPLENIVRAGISILIMANVVMVVLETVPVIQARLARPFYIAEVISVALFTLEYLLRMWAAVEEPGFAHPITGRMRHALTFFALIDLFAILPFYLPHLVPVDMRFLRGLRLVRLSRMFKLGRYSSGFSMYGQILREKRQELLVSMALLFLLLLVASSIMYYLESTAQPEHFSSIPAAMWWGIITLTTVGYGDVFPITVWGRVFGGVIAVIGLGFVALPSAILVGGMMEHMARKRQEDDETAAAAAPAAGRRRGRHQRYRSFSREKR
jgi:voltage-gated potassium channel